MEVRTEPWPSRRGNGPHPVGWPVQRIHSLACEAAAPVCFGQGFASLASGVPWNRCHPLKRETVTVSPDLVSTCATQKYSRTWPDTIIRNNQIHEVHTGLTEDVALALWDTHKPRKTGTAGRAPAGADSVPYQGFPMPLHGLHIHVLGLNFLYYEWQEPG